MGTLTFTDSAAAEVPIKAFHINDIRTALNDALGAPAGGYTDASLAGVAIRAIHFQEIRSQVK